MKFCHKCKTEWDGVNQPGAGETCEKCFADLHVCLNCVCYDEHKTNQCGAGNVEPVSDKAKSNHCEEFQFADRKLPGGAVKDADKAKDRWNKLFGK